LKKRLALECANDVDAYTASKTEFILSILARCGMSAEALRSISELNRPVDL
jgi:hypothetical protein